MLLVVAFLYLLLLPTGTHSTIEIQSSIPAESPPPGSPKRSELSSLTKQSRIGLEDLYGHLKAGKIQSVMRYYDSSFKADYGNWPANVPWSGHWVIITFYLLF
jgi:hypothetical protein